VMKRASKPIAALTIADLRRHSVWTYVDDDTPDETYVTPLTTRPVCDFSNVVFGTEIRLANGHRHWALLAGLHGKDVRANEQLLGLVVIRHKERFNLARYHDVDYARRGPAALAAWLGLAVSDVFPISYDIRAVATGLPGVVQGTIPQVPQAPLSQSERIAIALGDD